jgi:hypothetical protein
MEGRAFAAGVGVKAMRKALFGLLMATALVAPAMAQEAEMPESYRRMAERNQADADRQAQREAQRAERQAERAQQRMERQAEQPRAERREERMERREERIERRGDDGQSIFRREQRQERREDRQEQRAVQQNLEIQAQQNAERERRRGERAQRVYPADMPESYRRQWDRNERAVRQQERRERIERREDRRDDRRWSDGGSNWGDSRNQRRWDRRWRQDNRYDWQRYRYTNRSIFRPGPYYSPYRNHGYSRFSIGITLGRDYYSNRYWINDPWQYRLPQPYPGTRWVRYYNDVLLVPRLRRRARVPPPHDRVRRSRH